MGSSRIFDVSWPGGESVGACLYPAAAGAGNRDIFNEILPML
jgi:hypothetical protein